MQHPTTVQSAIEEFIDLDDVPHIDPFGTLPGWDEWERTAHDEITEHELDELYVAEMTRRDRAFNNVYPINRNAMRNIAMLNSSMIGLIAAAMNRRAVS